MTRPTRPIAVTATRPSRLLVILAVAWVAAAIALGGVFTSPPDADASGRGAGTGVVTTASP
jgi:hypothetical protein